MCGIFGMIGNNDLSLLKEMGKSLNHRGPDDYGYYLNSHVALGVRRLSVIDTQNGHQPIEEDFFCIAYNGEVYNFKELRRNLEQKGHTFSSNCDTEVILRSYQEYQKDCVNYLNGMFAFAIWDDRKQQLFLARDRLGIKPLYFWNNGNYLLFASEIKAILQDPNYKREVEPTALYNYFSRLYIPGELTIFKGIRKLQPGNTLICSKESNSSLKCEVSCYWDIDFSHKLNFSEQEFSEGLLENLILSVKNMMTADVPIGAFLSGGLDSSIIVSLAANINSNRLNTFSLGFNDKNTSFINELSLAQRTAKHFSTEHHEVFITPKKLLMALPKSVWYLDEPYCGGLPQYFLAQLASQKIKVVLSGLGADELFGNYGKGYVFSQYYNISADKFINVNYLSNLYADWESPFTPSEKKLLCKSSYLKLVDNKHTINKVYRSLYHRSKAVDFSDRLTYIDMKTQLVDEYLHYTDSLSMAHGIEVRVPFLDHKLVEFIAKIPFSIRSKNFEPKHLLKNIANHFLPKDIVQRPKVGFSLPINNWLHSELRILIDLLLSDKRLKNQEYFNDQYVKILINNFFTGSSFPEDDYRIWNLLMFQLWHLIFIEKNSYTVEDLITF